MGKAASRMQALVAQGSCLRQASMGEWLMIWAFQFARLYGPFAQGQGWTWERFCKEAGYGHQTPYRWFEKYGLPITKASKGGNVKLQSPKPLRSHTKPEVKSDLDKVVLKTRQTAL